MEGKKFDIRGHRSFAVGGTPSPENQQQENAEVHFAQQLSAACFERYKGYDHQELLGYITSNYLLSGDDFKIPIEAPLGIISQLPSPQLADPFCYFLIPVEDDLPPFELREAHQLIRELTIGIYVMNQIPSLALEANFDESTTVLLPPAYLDTRVGQIMANVDYMMKGLWHGALLPKDKRLKFCERWRGSLDVNQSGKPETKKNILAEFQASGLIDVTNDPDYAGIYDEIDKEGQHLDPSYLEERRFFMKFIDDYCMTIYLYQNTIPFHQNMYMVDADWTIKAAVKLLEDQVDKAGRDRLVAKLQLQELMLQRNLGNKLEIRRQLYVMKFISYMVPFLIAMRKKMKIPEISKFLPKMTGEDGDDVRTEREFPPLMLSSEYRYKAFSFGTHYFHLHGGVQIDYETPDPKPAVDELKNKYDPIIKQGAEFLKHVDDSREQAMAKQENFALPTLVIQNKKYFLLPLEFETFYPQHPQRPKWVQIMCENISKSKVSSKRSVNEHVMYDVFKKYFGPKKALKCKGNVPYGLKVAACRSMVSIFATMLRKTPVSRLGKQDEQGMALMHYASMNNRPNIIAILYLMSMDVNIRKYTANTIHDLKSGPTPLHLASQFGSLGACSCLISAGAQLHAIDHEGWAPIHCAAFFDHKLIVKLMVRKNENLLELPTKDKTKSVPLLLAASAGSLGSLKTLIDMGSNILRRDEQSNNVIHLAALRFHTNVLEFFIKWDNKDVPVWEILVEMLKSEEIERKDAAVKCLEVLSTSETHYWKCIVDGGSVPALVALLHMHDEIELQAVAASVLCNISEHTEVREALSKANAAPILIQLLQSSSDDIQSRSAVILADLACVEDNQSKMATLGIVPALIGLLESELEDVLLHAVNAIRIMSFGNPSNQAQFAAGGAIEPLVEFLTLNSDRLQAAAAAAVAALAYGHKENQDLFIQEQVVKPLVALVKCRRVEVQVKAAAAMEAMADYNEKSQKAFLEVDAPKQLLKLLKIWQIDVKEQGAMAMWALAGQVKSQQKDIASRIGISNLIEMLMIQSEKLQYVGCMGMVALGREDLDSQNQICEQGGIAPLVRLLRSSKTTRRIMLTVIKVMGVLCLGQALQNNEVTQQKMAEEGAIHTLIGFMLQPPGDSEEIQVEAAHTIACIVLCNSENQSALAKEQYFKFDVLLDLLCRGNPVIRLRSGQALAMFAFNNLKQQMAVKKAGGILFDCFEEFLFSKDPFEVANAAFQVVVLSRIILDRDQVTLTADGIQALVKVFRVENDNAVILAAGHLSSLSHTRAGIPDALITMGTIDLLISHLYSNNEEVRVAVAVCLGYLSFNMDGSRFLFSRVRNTPGLYDRLISNIGTKPKISEQFLSNYRNACKVGIPCLSLEKNGGLPSDWGTRPRRPDTSKTSRILSSNRKSDENTRVIERAKTAPAHGRRQYSGKSFRPESRNETLSINIETASTSTTRDISVTKGQTHLLKPSTELDAFHRLPKMETKS